MRKILLTLFVMCQYALVAQERIYLYPNAAEVTHKGFDTTAPFIDYYPAKTKTAQRTAILVCPGGGYSRLAWEKEGILPARFFTEQGIDVFVLLYRVNNTKQEGHRYPAQYNDVTRAIRTIRSRAEGWGIDPAKVGVMGFSAGGHLASTLTTMIQEGDPSASDPLLRISTRPAFSILMYPVITMDTSFAHRGSRNMLLGPNPDAELVKQLSTENRVTDKTPPVFLVHSDDDKVVPPMNSIAFYAALKQHKIPATLYLFDHGGHGYGMGPNDPLLNQWPGLALQWLHRLGF